MLTLIPKKAKKKKSQKILKSNMIKNAMKSSILICPAYPLRGSLPLCNICNAMKMPDSAAPCRFGCHPAFSESLRFQAVFTFWPCLSGERTQQHPERP